MDIQLKIHRYDWYFGIYTFSVIVIDGEVALCCLDSQLLETASDEIATMSGFFKILTLASLLLQTEGTPNEIEAVDENSDYNAVWNILVTKGKIKNSV